MKKDTENKEEVEQVESERERIGDMQISEGEMRLAKQLIQKRRESNQSLSKKSETENFKINLTVTDKDQKDDTRPDVELSFVYVRVEDTVDDDEEVKTVAIREEEEQTLLEGKKVEKTKRKIWTARLRRRDTIEHSETARDDAKNTCEEEENLVTKMKRKFEEEQAQSSAKLHKSYLEKPWRREACTPVCEQPPGS